MILIILYCTLVRWRLLTFFSISGPCSAVTAAATAAEPQPAAVCAGPAGPPHRNPAAACAIYHLPDATWSAEWVWCYITPSEFSVLMLFSVWFSFLLHLTGLLQAQNLLTPLPQSQANLLQTQPSITLATQVRGKPISSTYEMYFLANPDSKHTTMFTIWVWTVAYLLHK